jgi:serine protease Do
MRRFSCLLALFVGFGLGTNELPVCAQVDQSGSLEHLRALKLTAAAIRAATKKAEPALVTIVSTGGVKSVAGRIGGIREQGEGNTTGVVISPDGYVVTSTFNFIQRPPVITVITSTGQTYVADLLGQDNTRKICLLKLREAADLPVIERVDPAEIQVGQWAISIGVGFGDSNPAVSSGIISAKNRVGGKAIQTDANISPACYGGPLVDLQGRLLGICVPMNPQSQAIGAGVEWYDSGIGFAIPLVGIDDVLERLKQGEKIEPAFLGVQATPTNNQPGLVIQEVVPKSAAETAGLQKGERILTVDGVEVLDVAKLKQLLSRYEAGKKVKIALQAADSTTTREVEVTLAAPLPDPKQSQIEPPKIR